MSLELKTGDDEFFVSNNPNSAANTSSINDQQNRALEQLLGFAAKHLAPDLAKQLAAQAGTASFQLRVNNKTALRVNAGPQGLTFGAPKNPALQNAPSEIAQLDAGTGLIDGHPITPEPSNIGKIFKIMVWAIIIGVLAYIFVLSRH